MCIRHLTYGLLLFIAMMLATACTSGDEDSTNNKVTVPVDEDDDNTTSPIDEHYTYTLPIIFHVLYQDTADTTQHVSSTRLSQILTNVNDLYTGQLYGESQNIKVHFKLAEYNESGNKLATPGVEYIRYNGSYPIDPNRFMDDKTGVNKKYLWEPSEYINVMIYPFAANSDKSDITLGITHMPYSTEGNNELDGLQTVKQHMLTKHNLSYPHCVSINSLYIYDEATRYRMADHGQQGYQYSSVDINVTMSHELGHYLGLYHIFTEKRTDESTETLDDCDDTDFCDDTPSYNKVSYDRQLNAYLNQHRGDTSINISELTQRTACDASTFISANIMDYAVGLGFKFSADQKKRMRHVLYYSPLIPGPKKSEAADTRASNYADTTIVNLPVRTIKCTVKDTHTHIFSSSIKKK